MSTSPARNQNGQWLPGGPSPYPDGGKPRLQLVTTALRGLAQEVELETGADGKPLPMRTRAQRMAEIIYNRAIDPDRKDAVLWARVFLERVDGAVRQEVAMDIGMGELLAQAHERWLKRG